MTLTEIDRLFFEHLRLAAVELGYLPDVTQYNTPEAYEQAKVTLIEAMGGIVEIFGVGSSENRDRKDVNRIILDRTDFSTGSIGGWGAYDYEKEGEHFKTVRYPDTMMDLEYEVRTVSKTAKFDRVMIAIIQKALGTMRFKKTVDVTGSLNDDLVMVKLNGSRNVTVIDYLERLYIYIAKDVWVQDFEADINNIAPLTTVNFYLYLNKKEEEIPQEGQEEVYSADLTKVISEEYNANFNNDFK